MQRLGTAPGEPTPSASWRIQWINLYLKIKQKLKVVAILVDNFLITYEILVYLFYHIIFLINLYFLIILNIKSNELGDGDDLLFTALENQN